MRAPSGPPRRSADPLRRSAEAGYATAELALTLPVLVLVVLAGVWAISVVSLKASCSDAVRLGARAAARGEPAELVRDVVLRELPARAVVAVSGAAGGAVSVRASVAVQPVGALAGLLPHVTVSATAVAPAEPGASVSAGPS